MSRRLLLILSTLALLVGAAIYFWPHDDQGPPSDPKDTIVNPTNVGRGAYLAKAGDCIACHTVRGGAPFAGGRAIDTPFGKIYSPNITPDDETGLGNWSADDFWEALHNGRARDGHLLYPAFPYTNYTKVTRHDADQLYAYLRSVAPQNALNKPNELRFPFNLQVMLKLWRVLYFRPSVFMPTYSKSIEWNRGAYLVEGLGHCSACHSSRNALGATEGGLTGGLISSLGWYAPSLTSNNENGLGSWERGHVSLLLKTGNSPRATVFGPMAEVVQQSLQHLNDSDLDAMVTYLKALPSTAQDDPADAISGPKIEAIMAQGKRLYQVHCADCHGLSGVGMPPAYPPLAGNRSVLMENAANSIRIVLNGGFAPSTDENRRPYGMPPYSHVLSDYEVAAVVTYLRMSWGNQSLPVTATEVNHYRSVPLE